MNNSSASNTSFSNLSQTFTYTTSGAFWTLDTFLATPQCEPQTDESKCSGSTSLQWRRSPPRQGWADFISFFSLWEIKLNWPFPTGSWTRIRGKEIYYVNFKENEHKLCILVNEMVFFFLHFFSVILVSLQYYYHIS